jgi:hypothetical protein
MVDSFANFYNVFRTMEAKVNSGIDNNPLYDKDVPPSATVCPPSKLKKDRMRRADNS